MAKQIKLSYRFGATKAEKEAWRALYEAAKAEGLSQYYLKQIFGKPTKGNKTARTDEAKIARNEWQSLIFLGETPKGKLTSEGTPRPIKRAKASKRAETAADEYYNSVLDWLEVYNKSDITGKPLHWSEEQIHAFRLKVNEKWHMRRSMKGWTDDFFEFLDSLSSDSTGKVKKSKSFSNTFEPIRRAAAEFAEQMREDEQNALLESKETNND